MPVESSQGSTVSFGGSPLGNLTGISVKSGTASGVDVTSIDSPVSGGTIAREVDVLAIEPGSVDVTFLGPPSGLVAGAKGDLVVVIGGDTVIDGEAFVAECPVEAAVGDIVRSSVSFRLTGATGS